MTNWKKLIEENRAKIEKAIFEAWEYMLTDDYTVSMENAVLLWDDGDITTHYRDQNSFSEGEFNGKAICITAWGGQKDEECYNTFVNDYDTLREAEEEYVKFYSHEYPIDTDEIIDRVLTRV